MRFRTYIYLFCGFCIVFNIVLNVVLKAQGLTDPLSWGSIVEDITFAIPATIVGFDITFTPQGFLNWLNSWLPSRPAVAFRLAGIIALLLGLLLWGAVVQKGLVILGIVPSPYSP